MSSDSATEWRRLDQADCELSHSTQCCLKFKVRGAEQAGFARLRSVPLDRMLGRADEQHLVAASLKFVWNTLDLNAKTAV